MKNYVCNLAVVTGLAALFGSSVILAQHESRETANVPFAFHASSTTLPAGKYAVALNNSLGFVQISDTVTGHSIMVATRGRESGKNDTPRLTFHRYGNEYFLSQIWMPGQTDGYSLGKSAREKEMAKQPGQIVLASIRLAGK
ncbi:MAG: hypothetical protein ACR2NN_21830 [Bryobacteraceae bacterium]